MEGVHVGKACPWGMDHGRQWHLWVRLLVGEGCMWVKAQPQMPSGPQGAGTPVNACRQLTLTYLLLIVYFKQYR